MQNRIDAVIEQLGKYAPDAAAAIVVASAGVVLAGWLAEAVVVESVAPGLVTMKVSTAVCLLLAGASLWFQCDPKPTLIVRRLAQACALAVVAVVLIGVSPALLAYGQNAEAMWRMGTMAAVYLFLLGMALFWLDAEIGRSFGLAQWLALFGTVGGIAGLMGYAFSAGSFYNLFADSSMALHTWLLFTVLGVGILQARPDRGFMGPVMSQDAGGVFARRVLPAVVMVPAAIIWLRMQGQREGFFDEELGAGIAVGGILAFLVIGTWLAARSLNRVYGELNRVNRQLATEESSPFLVETLHGS